MTSSPDEQQLPRYLGEIFEDSAVVIVFTVGSYELPPEKKPDSANIDFHRAVSFNIKAVVVLASGEKSYTGTDLPDEPLWGVIPKEIEEEEVVEEDGDEF